MNESGISFVKRCLDFAKNGIEFSEVMEDLKPAAAIDVMARLHGPSPYFPRRADLLAFDAMYLLERCFPGDYNIAHIPDYPSGTPFSAVVDLAVAISIMDEAPPRNRPNARPLGTPEALLFLLGYQAYKQGGYTPGSNRAQASFHLQWAKEHYPGFIARLRG